MQPRILVVDDSITELRVLMEMLTAKRWRVAVAFDGNDGYQKALLTTPDLILLDVRMPGIDGFAACRLLKADERTRHIPVIFLSAAEDRADRLAGLSLGAVDYIAKPYASEEEVIARIGIHLDLAQRIGAAAPADTQSVPDPAADALMGDTPMVRAAAAILLDNLTYPPSPETLARRLGTNEKRLNEAFQQSFALPIFGWLREQRLRIAKDLLAQTETSIRDIGLHCGYSSSANFATAFRERFDCTPRDFRRNRRATAELDAQPGH